MKDKCYCCGSPASEKVECHVNDGIFHFFCNHCIEGCYPCNQEDCVFKKW